METLRTLTTVTDGEALDGGGEQTLALTIALHPDPRFVGAQRLLLSGGGALRVGRAQPTFGAGALDDARLSREHFEVRDGRLRDLGSRNGTRLNGAQVEAAPLAHGDVVGAGQILFLAHRTRPGARRSCEELVGQSAALAEVVRQVELVAKRETTVLVLGETGTGKELVARALHRSSKRRGRFVALNCGGVAEGVLQSELFGHRKGAFSGAGAQREGLVAQAAGGTLLLDEVGDAGPALQVALLRLLQEREYRPVGADAPVRTDARFVAATHQPLEALVEAGRFRQDLWARLSRWVVRVPPLRERPEDIPLLVRAFTRRYAGRALQPTRRLMMALLRHPWPGNVRELDGVVERCVVSGEDERLDLDAGVSALLKAPDVVARPAPQAPRLPHDRPAPEVIVEAVRAAAGNMKRAAVALGVSRSTLYRWVTEEGLDVAAIRSGS